MYSDDETTLPEDARPATEDEVEVTNWTREQLMGFCALNDIPSEDTTKEELLKAIEDCGVELPDEPPYVGTDYAAVAPHYDDDDEPAGIPAT